MDDAHIEKVCNGDTEAFRYFITTYKDMAFTVAVSVVKDEYYAEEVVQDAFMKAFKGLKSFNRKAKFSTWFYRILINEAFMRLNKMKKEIVSFVPEYEQGNAAEHVLSSLSEDEQRHCINEALKKLPPKESLALRLFYLQEASIKEMGEMTGWSASNIKVILHRARKKMQTVLQQVMKSEL